MPDAFDFTILFANFVSNGDGRLYIRLLYVFYSALLIFSSFKFYHA